MSISDLCMHPGICNNYQFIHKMNVITMVGINVQPFYLRLKLDN